MSYLLSSCRFMSEPTLEKSHSSAELKDVIRPLLQDMDWRVTREPTRERNHTNVHMKSVVKLSKRQEIYRNMFELIQVSWSKPQRQRERDQTKGSWAEQWLCTSIMNLCTFRSRLLQNTTWNDKVLYMLGPARFTLTAESLEQAKPFSSRISSSKFSWRRVAIFRQAQFWLSTRECTHDTLHAYVHLHKIVQEVFLWFTAKSLDWHG